MSLRTYLSLACCSIFCLNAYAQTTPLEAWEFNDDQGTALSACSNSAGNASFTTSNAATNGSGQLVLSQDSTDYYRNANSTAQSSGQFQLEFNITSADLSTGDASGANFSFGLRESSSNKDLFLIRVAKSNSRLILQTRIDNSNTTIHDFGSGVSTISNFSVRCSIDLESQTADVYYSEDGESEQLGGTVSLSTAANTWDQIRYLSICNPTDWGANDTAKIDYLRVSSGVPRGISYTTIPLNSDKVYVQGAKFTNIDGNGMNFHRFDSSILESTNTLAKVNPVRAKTTSGVKLSLYTRSPSATLEFAYLEGDENRNSNFGLYQNGVFTHTEYVAKTSSTATIHLQSNSAEGELVRHDIVLPNWSNPILSKLEVESGYTLEAASPERQTRIAFLGDSISHGSGQGASYETYPFIATEKLNAKLYNLAVGGGKISPPIADMLQHFEALDAIWVLVGYNNWQGSSHDIATITGEYEALLTTIRSHQPNAEVFCSTLTYTRNTADLESGVTAEEMRTAVAGIVNARIAAGDDRLHLVRAEEFTNDSYLRFEEDGVTPTSDAVHFSVEGAAMFGNDVFEILSPFLMPDGATGVWDFDYNTTGNTAHNRATADDSLEAELYIDGSITTDGYEGEALTGRAQITGFDFGDDRNLSVEFDLKMASITGQQRLFRMVNGTDGVFIGLQNGKVVMKLNGQPQLVGSTVITADSWHTIAATWNRDTRRATVYLDGVEENSAVYPTEILPGTINGINGLTLGLSDATIDRVRVANRVADFITNPSTVTYADWSATFNWQGEPQTAQLENPDGDALSNLEEFIYGTNPISADSAETETAMSGTTLNFTLGRSSQDVEYLVQFSNDLSDWSSLPQLEIHGQSADAVSVQLNQHLSEASGFARVQMRSRVD